MLVDIVFYESVSGIHLGDFGLIPNSDFISMLASALSFMSNFNDFSDKTILQGDSLIIYGKDSRVYGRFNDYWFSVQSFSDVGSVIFIDEPVGDLSSVINNELLNHFVVNDLPFDEQVFGFTDAESFTNFVLNSDYDLSVINIFNRAVNFYKELVNGPLSYGSLVKHVGNDLFNGLTISRLISELISLPVFSHDKVNDFFNFLNNSFSVNDYSLIDYLRFINKFHDYNSLFDSYCFFNNY